MSEVEDIHEVGRDEVSIDSGSTLTGLSFGSVSTDNESQPTYNPGGLLDDDYEEGHIPNAEFSGGDIQMVDHTPSSHPPAATNTTVDDAATASPTPSSNTSAVDRHTNSDDGGGKKKARRTESIAHNAIFSGNVVYFLIDSEHAGSKAGPIQYSIVVVDNRFNVLGEFNEYIRPTCSADDWKYEGHSLRPEHDVIKNLDTAGVAWLQANTFMEKYLENEKKTGNVCHVEWKK